MRVLGTVLLTLLLCLGVAGTVSAQDSPLLLSSISLSSASVTEGRSLQGTVTLNMAAPANGVAVSLAADPAGAAVVPASGKDSGRRHQRDLRGQRERSYRRHDLWQLRCHQERISVRDASHVDR